MRDQARLDPRRCLPPENGPPAHADELPPPDASVPEYSLYQSTAHPPGRNKESMDPFITKEGFTATKTAKDSNLLGHLNICECYTGANGLANGFLKLSIVVGQYYTIIDYDWFWDAFHVLLIDGLADCTGCLFSEFQLLCIIKTQSSDVTIQAVYLSYSYVCTSYVCTLYVCTSAVSKQT